jgi:hypothetical protein
MAPQAVLEELVRLDCQDLVMYLQGSAHSILHREIPMQRNQAEERRGQL